MESDNLPSTSNRAKHLKKVSEKFNASCRYPVAFEEFRRFTNVDEYVVKEMERSGPDICRINYNIRHKYYPIVYKKFYESRSVREKMMRRGLSIKPIPRFLKERLMRMPGEDQPFSHKTKDKSSKVKVDAKIKSLQTKHSRSFTAISPAFKILTEKTKKTIKKSVEKETSLRHTPRITGKSKLKTPRRDDKAIAEDSAKITNFFASLKLVRNPNSNSENISNPNRQEGDTRKRKPETGDISPVGKRLKDVGTSNVSPNVKKSKNTGRPFESKSMPSSPFSRRRTEDDRMQERKKNLNKLKNDENSRKTQMKSRTESNISDDSDIHSYGENLNSPDSKNISRRKTNSGIGSPLQKSPLPKRNRIEDFQKPNLSPKKSVRKKDTHKSDTSDVEMELLSLSGAPKKTTVQVSSEIQDWLNKAMKTLEDESDDESVLSFFEEEFTAIDKLKAIEKYPNDVRNYIKYLLNAEIKKRNIANIKPVKHRGVTKSKVVEAFAEMTFDDYKILINAEKIYSQGLAELKTFEEITSSLKIQYDAIIEGKRAWPRDQHVKLTTLRTYLRSKGIHGDVDLKYIPPRLLSFEECLEHTNLKECTSFSRPKPPGSYKQLMNMCKKTYLKCCTEGVWTDGLKFIDLNNQPEEIIQYTQFKSMSHVLPSIQEITDQSTNTSVESISKSQNSSDEKQGSLPVNDQSGGNSLIENQANSSKNSDIPADDVERALEEMFAESQSEPAKSSEPSERTEQIVAEQQHNISLYRLKEITVSQPLLGLIPPSPCLFQSSGESDQKICESQQVRPRPPEALFIPCNRSMILNTEENKLTVKSVDHGDDSQDPFAETNEHQGRRLDNSPVQVTIQDSSVLESVVKNEPCTALSNNTQDSYDPLDDSVQILDIPPSEPIVIEDEESAPDLLNMLLTGPAQDNSNLTKSIQNNTTTATANSSPTQPLSCTEPFVHAQQLPSNLSSVQSQLNPHQPPEEDSKPSIHLDIDSCSPILNVKTEKEFNMEAEIEHCDIDLIMNILKTDTQESVAIYEQSLSRRRSLQSPGNVNEIQPPEDVDSSKAIEDDHTNRNDGLSTISQRRNDVPPIGRQCEGSLVESSYVSIPPQKIPSEVEGTICIQESTANEKQQHFRSLIADNQISEETESINKKNKDNVENLDASSNSVSVYIISTQNGENLVDTQVETSVRLDEPLIIDIKRLNKPNLSSEESPVEQTSKQPTTTGTDTNVSEKVPGEVLHSINEEDRQDEVNINMTHVDIQRRVSQGMQEPLGDDSVPEKTNITKKDLNDNLSEDTLDLVEVQQAPVQEISNDAFHQNLKGNKNVSETEISSKGSDIQLMQVSEEDNSSVDNQVETDVLKVVEATLFSDNRASLRKLQSEYVVSFHHGISHNGDDINETEGQSTPSAVSRNADELEEQSSASTSCATEEDTSGLDVNNLATVSSYELVEDLVQKEEEMSSGQTDDSSEMNQCAKVILMADESNSDFAGFDERKSVSQPILSDANQQTSSNSSLFFGKITRSEHQTEGSSNFVLSHNIPVNPLNEDRIQANDLIESITKASSLIFTSEALNLNNQRTYVLPALLPIATLQSDNFIQTPGVEDESEVDKENENLVEVPILISRRFIKMLPFNIATPQQFQQTTNESTIFAIKTKLEFCLQELGVSDTSEKENEAIPIPQQLESSTKQQKTAERAPSDKAEPVPKANCTKRCQGAMQKSNGRLRLGKLKADSCTSVEKQLSNASKKSQHDEKRPTVSSDTKINKTSLSTQNKIKKVSPKKVVKKPSVLDFVPQKIHPFRSLPLGVTKKVPASAANTEMQTNEQKQSNCEESNYNIEDVSQAVASSTASQMLGTDCTYFESSQLLRSVEGCCKPTEAQGPSEEHHRKPLTEPKVNTFACISLSEGLLARKVWQVNLSWKARQKMSIEVRFSVNRYGLTVCNSSAQLLFNFSPVIWSDILRVLREIDHFEYKRLAVKNYRAATPLHKALEYLFHSAQEVANVKLIIDGHNPYATCEEAKPLYRKPFQCLTKAIAPNILSRMKALKDSLSDNVMDE